MRNRKEEFLKNINLHISKQQDEQTNNYYQNKNNDYDNHIIIGMKEGEELCRKDKENYSQRLCQRD